MAIPVFDNASSVQNTAQSVLTIPAFAVVGGSGSLIFVGVGSSAPTPDLTTSVVRNGTEVFTEIFDFIAQGSYHISGHYFLNPGAGSFSIVVTFGGTEDEVCAGAISLTGTDPTAPIGTHGTASGATGAPTVTVAAAADEMLVDIVYQGVQTAQTAGADQTMRWQQDEIGFFSTGAGSTQPGTANDIMSWSGNNPWLIGAVPIKGPQIPPLSFPPYSMNPMRNLIVR